MWRQNASGIQDSEGVGDRYGYTLVAGNFDGDDYADLAIGIPYEAIGSTEQAGAVNVIYGSGTGLTAAGDQLWYKGGDGLQGAVETGDRFGYALATIPVSAMQKVYLPLVVRNQ